MYIHTYTLAQEKLSLLSEAFFIGKAFVIRNIRHAGRSLTEGPLYKLQNRTLENTKLRFLLNLLYIFFRSTIRLYPRLPHSETKCISHGIILRKYYENVWKIRITGEPNVLDFCPFGL